MKGLYEPINNYCDSMFDTVIYFYIKGEYSEITLQSQNNNMVTIIITAVIGHNYCEWFMTIL